MLPIVWPTGRSRPATEAGAWERTEQANILVVSPDGDFVGRVSEALARRVANVHMLMVRDQEEALQVMADEAVDCALVDAALPPAAAPSALEEPREEIPDLDVPDMSLLFEGDALVAWLPAQGPDHDLQADAEGAPEGEAPPYVHEAPPYAPGPLEVFAMLGIEQGDLFPSTLEPETAGQSHVEQESMEEARMELEPEPRPPSLAEPTSPLAPPDSNADEQAEDGQPARALGLPAFQLLERIAASTPLVRRVLFVPVRLLGHGIPAAGSVVQAIATAPLVPEALARLVEEQLERRRSEVAVERSRAYGWSSRDP